MPGCVDGVYTIDRENWTEVLGLIYAGLQRDGSKDCNGDLRRSLVASWASLFPSGSMPAAPRCAGPGDPRIARPPPAR